MDLDLSKTFFGLTAEAKEAAYLPTSHLMPDLWHAYLRARLGEEYATVQHLPLTLLSDMYKFDLQRLNDALFLNTPFDELAQRYGDLLALSLDIFVLAPRITRLPIPRMFANMPQDIHHEYLAAVRTHPQRANLYNLFGALKRLDEHINNHNRFHLDLFETAGVQPLLLTMFTRIGELERDGQLPVSTAS